MSYHQRRYHHRQESYGHGVPKVTHPKLLPKVSDDTGSWRSLPAWEKRFCTLVGGMPWKRFVQAKRNLHKTDKVYEWNDSAGLKAFNKAKRRFWADFHGFPCKMGLPSSDMYIDKNIDWNPEIDPNLLSEIKAPSDGEEEVVGVAPKEIDWFSIPLDQIKPTGWDDIWDYTPQLPKTFRGMHGIKDLMIEQSTSKKTENALLCSSASTFCYEHEHPLSPRKNIIIRLGPIACSKTAQSKTSRENGWPRFRQAPLL
ncbi:uncharacterized protein LOC111290041 [Durio zibethinus]|uniref:Uncharacterized protein LOC111290041 n=1 Tax=Durio zibethinus TaxID=66656 RepID=A0A6P5Y9L3_DURZI|nr:uncharacterized protein LOC111290041 [Durio zibethinus]